MHGVASWLRDFGSILTPVAILVAATTFWWSTRHARQEFEDGLAKEYRAILEKLPVRAFYADRACPLDDNLLSTFHRYFDLSNEQLFLGKATGEGLFRLFRQGRISKRTLAQWRDGIEGNMKLPTFREAWKQIRGHLPSDFFEELRGVADKIEPP
jgi:hypothetical protein